MISDKDLEILYVLLDDPQESVRDEVDKKLLSFGEAIIEPLVRLDTFSGRANAERVEGLIHAIRHQKTSERFTLFLNNPNMDVNLEEGVFIIAKYGYPLVDIDVYKKKLDEMADDVRRMAGAHSTIGNVLLQLRTFLFSELGYLGNRHQYYDPDNTYFNRVIDRRIGIPISLSTLMLLLGQRLQLPLKGVGMPMHFLLRYDDGTRSFYIDAFNNGSMITRDQCRQMMTRSGFPFADNMLEPVSNKYMIERMLRNLLFAYQQSGNHEEVKNLTAFLIMFDPSYAAEFPDNDENMVDEEDDE